MQTRYALGPSIGVARLGNSRDSVSPEPEVSGALPIACDRLERDVAPILRRPGPILAGRQVVSTTNVIIGGGTAFRQGGKNGPNADAAKMKSTFRVETVRHADHTTLLQIQDTQTVLLAFEGLSRPHVSVATLQQVSA